MMGEREAVWTVYVLISHGGARTNVGITTDLWRRLAQHNGVIAGGAKATRAWRPWSLGATFGPSEPLGEALRAERRLKRRRGRERLRELGG